MRVSVEMVVLTRMYDTRDGEQWDKERDHAMRTFLMRTVPPHAAGPYATAYGAGACCLPTLPVDSNRLESMCAFEGRGIGSIAHPSSYSPPQSVFCDIYSSLQRPPLSNACSRCCSPCVSHIALRVAARVSGIVLQLRVAARVSGIVF